MAEVTACSDSGSKKVKPVLASCVARCFLSVSARMWRSPGTLLGQTSAGAPSSPADAQTPVAGGRAPRMGRRRRVRAGCAPSAQAAPLWLGQGVGHRASAPAPGSACLIFSLLSGLWWHVTSSEKLSLTSLENWEPHQASIFYPSYFSLVWDNHENVEFIFLRLEAQKKKEKEGKEEKKKPILLEAKHRLFSSFSPSFLQFTGEIPDLPWSEWLTKAEWMWEGLSMGKAMEDISLIYVLKMISFTS